MSLSVEQQVLHIMFSVERQSYSLSSSHDSGLDTLLSSWPFLVICVEDFLKASKITTQLTQDGSMVESCFGTESVSTIERPAFCNQCDGMHAEAFPAPSAANVCPTTRSSRVGRSIASFSGSAG